MSSIPPVSSTTPVTAPTSSTGSSTIPASVSASLSVEAGVVATFSDPNAADDGTADLYTNLANLSTLSTSNSGVDLNQQWANAVSADPSLAPLAEQMAANQALLNAVL